MLCQKYALLLQLLLVSVSGVVATPSVRPARYPRTLHELHNRQNPSKAKTIPFIMQSKPVDSPDPFEFTNSNNLTFTSSNIYVATLTVLGQDFPVQLDTGSADLWLETSGLDLSSFQDTGIPEEIRYVDGTSASGPVLIGNVTFGEFTVPQAFISAPGATAVTNGDKGLLGLSFPIISNIASALEAEGLNGAPLVQNIFDANPDERNIITFLLSRSAETGLTDGGIFTIGDIDSDFTAVNDAPNLPTIGGNFWEILMDGIIVNGQNFTGGSVALPRSQAAGGQTVAIMDTGAALAFLLPDYIDAIYQDVPGAEFDPRFGIYFVPCDAQIELSFVFGGVEYPVHPLDTVQAASDGAGGVICYAGFLANDDSTSDHLIGDSFLRNVYAVHDFGTGAGGDGEPSMQMLSITNFNDASAEFTSLSKARNDSILGRSDPPPPPTFDGSPSDGNSGNGGGDSGSNGALRTLPVWSVVGAGALGGALALLGLF